MTVSRLFVKTEEVLEAKKLFEVTNSLQIKANVIRKLGLLGFNKQQIKELLNIEGGDDNE